MVPDETGRQGDRETGEQGNREQKEEPDMADLVPVPCRRVPGEALGRGDVSGSPSRGVIPKGGLVDFVRG